jgi:hypothetical protein
MSRKRVKELPVRKEFLKQLKTVISTPSVGTTYSDEWWKEKPVSLNRWCTHFIRQPLFPIQLNFGNAMIGKSPFDFSNDYDEGHAFWGKGSGKDMTIAKMVGYTCYKLKCLKNAQKFLRVKYGCSIEDGDSIDIGNMSINARQANNVFFKKFKSVLKRCRNPNTGKNWFVEKGIDLRDGYDLMKSEVDFHDGIVAHSLNSETHTGEGLNLFIAIVDEFGAFPANVAFILLEAIRETVTSRFKEFGSVAVMSYHYYRNDPMHILYETEKKNPRVYSSKESTYRVNMLVDKKDLSKFYLKNPEKAKMTYDCDSSESEGGYVTKKYMLNKMFDSDICENPIKGDLISVDAAFLGNLSFKNWFTGSDGMIYAVHVDLATGKIQDKSGELKQKTNDCAGFTLLHVQKMLPKIDGKLKTDLAKEGIIFEMSDKVPRKGMIIDLSVQMMARRGQEIQLSDVREFIIRLKEEYNFNIVYVTYDGWQSKDSIQILTEQGMEADNLSVDKNNDAYDTWKELMYQQLIKCYPNNIALREAKELIVDEKGRINHPDRSWSRLKNEGIEKGSKDVMDSIAGAVLNAFNKIPVEVDVYFA